jgi:hypothetical protein
VLSFRFNTYLSADSTIPDPAVFRLTNVLLYCVLVNTFAFVCGTLFHGLSDLEIDFASVVFTLHPVHTETVASVVGRSDLLGALFLLWALYAAVRCLQINRSVYARCMDGLVTAVLFACASLSKDTSAAVFLPLVLVSWLGCRRAGFEQRRSWSLVICARTVFLRLILDLTHSQTGSWLGACVVAFYAWRLGLSSPRPTFNFVSNPAAFEPALPRSVCSRRLTAHL